MNGEWENSFSRGYVGLKRKTWEELMEKFKGKKRSDYRAILDYLFINANHTDNPAVIPGAGTIHLKRGQIYRSRKSLEDALGFSERRIRTLLANLEKCGIVSIETTNKGLIISLKDFDRYVIGNGQSDKQNDRQPTSKSQPSDHQATIDKNVNKNEKKNNSERQKVAAALLEMKIEGPKVREIIERHGLDHIKNCIAKAREKATENPAGYLLSMLDKEVAPTKALLAEKRQEDESRKTRELIDAMDDEKKKGKEEDEELDRQYEALPESEKAEVDRLAKESMQGKPIPGNSPCFDKIARRSVMMEFLKKKKEGTKGGG